MAEHGMELSAIMDKYMLRPTPMKQYSIEDVPGSYLSDESIIEKAANSKQGEKFKSLCNGEIPDDKSHSDADMALAAIHAFWCGGDIEQMYRLFRESGLMRDKCDRVQSGSTYGEITLKKAVAHASEFYKPISKTPEMEDFDDKAVGDALIRYAITVKEEELRKQYLKYCTTWQARRQRTIYISDTESVYPIAMSEFDKNIYSEL